MPRNVEGQEAATQETGFRQEGEFEVKSIWVYRTQYVCAENGTEEAEKLQALCFSSELVIP